MSSSSSSSSAASTEYNKNNPAIKRILSEVKELYKDKNKQFTAFPLEDNIFEWHFCLRGPVDTEFEEGIYHGRVILPSEYPFKPPAIIFLTPNGRFEVGKKICLTITGYHPEFWQPAWGIRTALLAIISFFPTKSEGAVGGLDWPKEERIELAKKSKMWCCSVCGRSNKDIMDEKLNKIGEEADTVLDKQEQEDLKMFSYSYENKESSTTDDTENHPKKAQEEQSSVKKRTAANQIVQRNDSGSSNSASSKTEASNPARSRTTRSINRRSKIYDIALTLVVLMIFIILLRRLIAYLM